MNVVVIPAVDAGTRDDAPASREPVARADGARALALAWLRLSQHGKVRISAIPPRAGYR